MLATSATLLLRRQAGASSAAASRAMSICATLQPSRERPVASIRPRRLQPRGTAARRSLSANAMHKLSVSPESLEVVKSTLPLVGEAGVDFTKHFYRRLFAAHPELLNVFNQRNQACGEQPQRLFGSVAAAAQAAITAGELPGGAIEGICQKHVALGVGREAYDVVGEHLLGTIEDLLTDDRSVLDAWGEMYGAIARAFVAREAEILHKVTNLPGSWAGRRPFVLADVERLSDVISRFKFAPKDGKPTPMFAPGAYTTVWAKVEGKGAHPPHAKFTEQPRHYTLAVPRDGSKRGDHLSISVKREGLVSGMLHDAPLGSEWELSAPVGHFTMDNAWSDDVRGPIVFLSGGVGITPVLAMLEDVAETRPATWLHAARDGNVHAYRDRLRQMAVLRGGELKRRVWYSDPTEADGAPGGDHEGVPLLYNAARYHFRGHMDLEAPELRGGEEDGGGGEELLHLDNPHAHYFMCGPGGFMDAQRESLKRLGVDEGRIHWEGF